MSINSTSINRNNNLPLHAAKKTIQIQNKQDYKQTNFLTIAPAAPILSKISTFQKLNKHSCNGLSSSSPPYRSENDQVEGCNIVTLQHTGESKIVVASRSILERERNPDRICLDKRGLTTFPWIIDEPKLRLISLQHNLISKIERNHLTQLTKLVFLDLYDNQIEKFCDLDLLENLRVLLIGKNKIKKIEGLKKLSKLEVLDLHGNEIMQISGLEESSLLKVLNLAGNNIKSIGYTDFQGLSSLKELNLRRNKIKILNGFQNTPQLQKLYLSNNDIQKIEDMSSLVKASQIKEISLDGNPVTLTTDCMSFLVSYLPNLQILSAMQINEQIRKKALAWRTTKEQSNSAFLDLNTQVCVKIQQDEAISKAKFNWQLSSKTNDYPNAGKLDKLTSLRNDQLKGITFQSLNLTTDSSKSKHQSRSKIQDLLDNSTNKTNNNNNNAMKKFYRNRSHSADNALKINNATYISSFDFKLPPILAPIIDNLTKSQTSKDSGQKNGESRGYRENFSDSSDSESLESHHSLKSGLRNYLVKSTGRSVSVDYNVNSSEHTFLVKYNKSTDDNSSVADSLSYATKEYLHRNMRKSLYSGDGQLECCFKSTSSHSKSDSMSKGSSLDCSSSKSEFDDSSVSSSKSSLDKSRITSAPNKKFAYYRSNRAAAARAKRKTASVVSPPLQPILPKEREQGGDYLIEIIGCCLNIYGQGALRFIDRQWDLAKANEISVVKFNYVHFNGIAGIFGKLKHKFPNAEQFFFRETNISHLGQLNALAEAQGLQRIEIEAEGNPIMTKNWTIYAIFRLAHWGLQNINGLQITEENISTANQEYSGLIDIVIWSLPESLLQPLLHRLHLEGVQKLNGEKVSAKQFLFSSDSALRNVVSKEALQWRRTNITQEDLIWRHKGKIFLSNSIEQTVQSIQKLQILNAEWPSILYEIVYNTLENYSNMCDYMKSCIKDLQEK